MTTNWKIMALAPLALMVGSCGDKLPQVITVRDKPIVIEKPPVVVEKMVVIDRPLTLVAFCKMTNISLTDAHANLTRQFRDYDGKYLTAEQIGWLIAHYKLRYEVDPKAIVLDLNSKAVIVDAYPRVLNEKLPPGSKILIMTPEGSQKDGLVSELKIEKGQETTVTSSAKTALADGEKWVALLERAVLRSGFHVLNRSNLADISREMGFEGKEALKISGADAILQITSFSKRDDCCYTHCGNSQIYDRSSGTQIENVFYDMFYIEVSARLILSNSEIIWSGTVRFPSTSLAKPGSIKGAISVVEARQDKNFTDVAPGGKLVNSRLVYVWEDSTGTDFVNEEEGLSPGNESIHELAIQGAFDTLVRAMSK